MVIVPEGDLFDGAAEAATPLGVGVVESQIFTLHHLQPPFGIVLGCKSAAGGEGTCQAIPQEVDDLGRMQGVIVRILFVKGGRVFYFDGERDSLFRYYPILVVIGVGGDFL